MRKRGEKGASGLAQINCAQPRVRDSLIHAKKVVAAVDGFVDNPLVFLSGRRVKRLIELITAGFGFGVGVEVF